MDTLKWFGLAEARRLVSAGFARFCGFGRVGRFSVVLLRVSGVEGVCCAVVGVGSRPVPSAAPAAVAFVRSFPAEG